MQQSLFNDDKAGSISAPQPKKEIIRKRNGHKKGTWDKKYYKEIYDWMRKMIQYSPQWYLKGEKVCPVEHAQTYFPLISDCVHRGDFEAAQATKDVIIDFLNDLGAEIPDDIEFKIPEYKPVEIRGIICYGKEDDPTGIASGGSEFI